MDKVTELGGGLFQVRVPLPFPLKWVNAYAMEDASGWTVIDPGLRTPDAEQTWAEALNRIGIVWSDIQRIMLTHHHPDHYGLAGWLQQRAGDAQVWMSQTSYEQADTLWGAQTETTTEALSRLFAMHGFPQQEQDAMRRHSADFIALVSPQPRGVRFIEYGERIAMGGLEYEALHTPGHAFGHVSFLHRESGTIFCGDHVLPGISPNIALLPFGDRNPLGSYISSVSEAAQSFSVVKALPGHREPFTQYRERCEELLRHHVERLAKMASMLHRRAMTGYELCCELFGRTLSVHQLRFALSETIAHLVYLEEEGTIRRQTDDLGVVSYRTI